MFAYRHRCFQIYIKFFETDLLNFTNLIISSCKFSATSSGFTKNGFLITFCFTITCELHIFWPKVRKLFYVRYHFESQFFSLFYKSTSYFRFENFYVNENSIQHFCAFFLLSTCLSLVSYFKRFLKCMFLQSTCYSYYIIIFFMFDHATLNWWQQWW